MAGALAGATYGASRQLDAVGTAALAVVGGLGGGVMRDVLLGTVPLALAKPSYLYTVLISALVGMFFGSMVDRLKLLVVILDTIALGLFTIVGASRALMFDLPPISAVMLGLVTGIGGGVVLDILGGDLPPGASVVGRRRIQPRRWRATPPTRSSPCSPDCPETPRQWPT